jgi:phage-related protein
MISMVGVTFGTKHSYDDFGLILSSKEIGLPEPQTETVSVIGRNGDIDLTEALGDTVTFNNRNLTFTFTLLQANIYWTSVLSKISNYLHGKKMQVILDADKAYYYYGRCKVNQYKSNKTLGTLVIECDVEPYKIEVNGAGVPWLWDTFSFVNGIIHVNEVTVNGTATENLINRAKVVSPTFTCSAAMKVTYNGTTYSLAAGTTTVYDIRLQEGNNYVTFSGEGTVKISYKGGSL